MTDRPRDSGGIGHGQPDPTIRYGGGHIRTGVLLAGVIRQTLSDTPIQDESVKTSLGQPEHAAWT